MRSALAALLGIVMAGHAHAQATGVKVKDGDVYVQLAVSTGRLTHEGHIIEATMSHDGNLVAYVQKGPALEDQGTQNDLYLCSVPQKSCVLAIAGRPSESTETNLTSIQNVRFSLQAGQQPAGVLAGSLFFLTDAGGANTLTLHRLPFGSKTLSQLLNAAPLFVTYANSLEIVPSGKFAGALQIEQQTYTDHGACGQPMIFDPNAHKMLQKTGNLDC